MSSGPNRSPKAGIAFFPLVTFKNDEQNKSNDKSMKHDETVKIIIRFDEVQS